MTPPGSSTTADPSSSPVARIISGLGDAPAPLAPSTDHALPQLKLDPRTYSRALDCVHCGLCLPACPTYTQNGLEADSPRGRIYLMKGLATGKVQATEAVLNHLDLCLDCRACETACPSGVVYHELLEETRIRLNAQRPVGLVDRLIQTMFFHVFPYATRLKLALLPVRVLQKLGLWKLVTAPAITNLLPAQLQKMQQMLPPSGPLWESTLGETYEAKSTSAATTKTVGYFAGCVGSVLFQDVNRQTIELLQLAGCRVLVPQSQSCCGAIHHHGGKGHEAEELAKRNIDAFIDEQGKPRVDYITTNIAGCGAQLKDYPHLLRDDAKYLPRARTFVALLRDANELLYEFKLAAPSTPLNLTVTYHDACHLAHAQRVTVQPRQLLGSIPGLKLIPLPESEICCGAAGTYNLSQPVMARDLAERKLKHIQSTGATICVTANVGCAMQIQSEADRLGVNLKVMHPITLLHQAHGAGKS